jgi:lipid-A-disaccharide synthase
MPEIKKLFILAGEPSGDRIAADLIKRLRSRIDLELTGIGGNDLVEQGLKPLFPMTDLSVMGLIDVAKRLPLLLWRIEQTARFIVKTQPHIVVLVDAQEFSALLANRLNALGYQGPKVLYVSPSVWARAPERAKKLVPLFREILAVLPFEPEVMERLGGPKTTYVGHPALAEMQPQSQNGSYIALLPGSRRGELRRHLPLLRQVAKQLAQKGQERFFMPTLPTWSDFLSQEVKAWAVPVEIVSDRAQRQRFYGQTKLAVVTAGTATLELALASVPMVVTYVMEKAQAHHFKALGSPRISLPNIILDQALVPEIVSSGPNIEAVLSEAQALLKDETARNRQLAGFATLQKLMQNGTPQNGREDPADRILAYF